MNLLITLCARGGSKGIPGKNIKVLNGQPLIGYSIKIAKKFGGEYNADITLSTDDPQIKEVAGEFGLTTSYNRPEQLSTDTVGKIETIKDILLFEEKSRNKKYDYILDLDVTSPMRTIEDLRTAFELLKKSPTALNLFSVNHAARNPYFNMVEKKDNGFYGLVKKGEFLTRQSAPHVYDLNASFYFYTRDFYTRNITSAITESSLIYLMPHICFDLDHIIDFEFMEYLLLTDKLGFKL